jgi:hypothetical protein
MSRDQPLSIHLHPKCIAINRQLQTIVIVPAQLHLRMRIRRIAVQPHTCLIGA